MDAYRIDNIDSSMSYQLCRTRVSDGGVDLVLNLVSGRETVSVTTIGRLRARDAVEIVSSCVARLEQLGLRPVEDAVACDRAA